jgi:hypothetical protein
MVTAVSAIPTLDAPPIPAELWGGFTQMPYAVWDEGHVWVRVIWLYVPGIPLGHRLNHTIISFNIYIMVT